MKELGIELIFANSPQAKGRVERANAILQDRLVKELRLRNISDIETANAYLPEFREKYNQKFAKEPRLPENAHRPLIAHEDLDMILVEKHRRVLSKNLECHFETKRYQITTNRPAYALRNAPVTVVSHPDGEVDILYKGKPLEHRVMQIYTSAPILNRKDLKHYLDTPPTYRENQSFAPTGI
ncbi:hypothetical protein AUK40_04995 [Candidatus Wirthbacteria bacterium CG2_30_54_11]|uniref:Integrase catalytic domain-containing protein n=1 Tax=Candidatus Wirthbacteria bacterium CG2_30_54_11 TaxID=1817892 RepID=A0A1J5IH72_9BACT|nr:MAG: hypothetical protein AUK40_04995 [Candidatus Wirthbacteria bacterium CG2_30_54_11]